MSSSKDQKIVIPKGTVKEDEQVVITIRNDLKHQDLIVVKSSELSYNKESGKLEGNQCPGRSKNLYAQAIDPNERGCYVTCAKKNKDNQQNYDEVKNFCKENNSMGIEAGENKTQTVENAPRKTSRNKSNDKGSTVNINEEKKQPKMPESITEINVSDPIITNSINTSNLEDSTKLMEYNQASKKFSITIVTNDCPCLEKVNTFPGCYCNTANNEDPSKNNIHEKTCICGRIEYPVIANVSNISQKCSNNQSVSLQDENTNEFVEGIKKTSSQLECFRRKKSKEVGNTQKSKKSINSIENIEKTEEKDISESRVDKLDCKCSSDISIENIDKNENDKRVNSNIENHSSWDKCSIDACKRSSCPIFEDFLKKEVPKKYKSTEAIAKENVQPNCSSNCPTIQPGK